MKTPIRKRSIFLASVLLVVGGLVLACFLWVRAEQRQYALNRQLIAALDKKDIRRALTLIDDGADPNTRVKPSPPVSLFQLVKRMWHPAAQSDNKSATALMIACGNIWQDENWHTIGLDSADAALTKAMLKHGGNVNARAQYGETALMPASVYGRTDIMELLLQHGANINAQNQFGQTALHRAIIVGHPEVVKILIKYGADVNIKTYSGWTPLRWELSEQNPQQRDESRNYSPQIVRLLKAAGAKE